MQYTETQLLMEEHASVPWHIIQFDYIASLVSSQDKRILCCDWLVPEQARWHYLAAWDYLLCPITHTRKNLANIEPS